MYQALYRKYRPLDFKDVVGQDIIVETLKNAVKYNHISHAYLFSGPRGTGKTTIAKIFARAVNCLEPVDGLACGKCKNCNYSFSNECMDIIEIDAASNNGVDEIRELRNKVNILPSELKYKVYIIDEVHMLSIGAFNALLKTIEEPPSHVIFILATTDPEKIPLTIISRCQWYNFKKITNDKIVMRLKTIVDAENINIDDEVLEKIAESSDGCLRDAISLLDKLYAYNLEKITVEDFYNINGQITTQKIKKFENYIFSANVSKVLELIETYYLEGKNLVQILKQLMLNIKDELFAYYISDQALEFSANTMVEFLNILNDRLVSIKKADDVRISVEITLLSYMNDLKNKNKTVEPDAQIKREEIRTNINEEKLGETKVAKEETTSNIKKKEDNIEPVMSRKKQNISLEQFSNLMEIRTKNTMIKAAKEELVKEINNYKLLDDYTFDQENGYLACELLDAKVRASSTDNLVISYDYEGMIEKLKDHLDKLEDFYNKITNANKHIAVITNEKWEQLKKEYIKLLNEGKHFEYQEEPSLNISSSSDKILSDELDDSINEVVELFGDIVEIE